MPTEVLLGIVPEVSLEDGVPMGAKQPASGVLYGVGYNAGGVARGPDAHMVPVL